MTVFHILAAASVLTGVIFVLATASRGKTIPVPWTVPAALSFAFAAFSLFTVFDEGLFGFWTNHTQNFWGLQVWMDLLLAIALSWTFLLPEAKRQGVSILPWALFVVTTASIGLFALMARILYLKQKDAAHQPA